MNIKNISSNIYTEGIVQKIFGKNLDRKGLSDIMSLSITHDCGKWLAVV
jgi:hypothetical protein